LRRVERQPGVDCRPAALIGLYSPTLAAWDGWVWIAGIALYLLCVAALRHLPR